MTSSILLSLLAGCAPKLPPSTLSVAPGPELLERGSYLVNGPGACGACHDMHETGDPMAGGAVLASLAGGDVFQEPGTRIFAPNITPDRETGIGAWSDEDIARAIRDGLRPDGRVLHPLMPYGAYRHLSDRDTAAIIAYLRSVPAVHQDRERFEPEIPAMARFAFQRLHVTLHEPAVAVQPPDPADPVASGRYVAWVAHCPECHSLGPKGPRPEDDPAWMAGSEVPFTSPFGKVWAPNLSPDPRAGIGSASAAELRAALVSGRRLDGTAMLPPMSLFAPHLAAMSDEDWSSLSAFLASLPAVGKAVPERELTRAGTEWVAARTASSGDSGGARPDVEGIEDSARDEIGPQVPTSP